MGRFANGGAHGRQVAMGLVVAALLAATALGAGELTKGEGSDVNPLLTCLAHQPAGVADAARTAPSAEGTDPDAEGGACALRLHPETYADLATAARGLGNRLAADTPGELAAGTAVRAAASRGAPAAARGRWHPVGRGPLHANDPSYPYTYGDGFADLSGRISDYSYDPKHKRLYAAVASGGVWMSKDRGEHWHSIGNSLPTQSVSSVAYSRASGGTLIAVTGDDAFGGNTYGGLGVFRSVNGGHTWRRARGVPVGAQGFKAAVDPGHPRTVYAATGAGLYRSTNDGRSFRNVKLPIGAPCQGSTFRTPNCFFANIVTDVVVRGKDRFGNKDGAVLAAIGWRAGSAPNFAGKPESPSNGLYYSSTGKPGSFQRLDVNANGFAPQGRIGRVELGAATGPQQNHDYVYAIVQDSLLFDTGTLEGLDVPNVDIGGIIAPLATPTYLNGIYVSKDFGLHWTLMESREEVQLPTSGSVLATLQPLGFGPGIQSWYDEWIKPDPTAQQGGVPTRVVFGLEELYANTLPLPQSGHSNFHTIGAYNANGGACLLVIATPVCSELQQATPDKTTTHPDQHGGIFIPDGHGGVTLVAGNDGGNYTQTIGQGGSFTQSGWGQGAQGGLHTLLPYGVTAARDGTVYMGMQDNGEGRISKGGRQVEVYGGDGVFTQVNPKDSNVVYEELPDAGTSVSTDGGKSWADIDPLVDNASFYAPLVMDPKNPNHLLTGGREIVETTAGPNTTSPGTDPSTDWQRVMNLGRANGVQNQVTAIGVRGKYVYAGYCGSCDTLVNHHRFGSGLATNVGGKKAPKLASHHGWHKAAAKGLPHRYITDVTIDPRNPRTIYVTLGASDVRPYAPPRAAGNSGISVGGGHIYKSTNAGRTFHDISGNLRQLPALWSLVRGHQLLVATTNGVYVSTGLRGGHYSLLGRNLPAAPVFSMQLVPGHPRQLVVASLGRGVYRYTFPRRR